MRVARYREDVACEVCRVPSEVFGARASFSPVLEVAVDVGGPYEGGEDEDEVKD